MGSMPHQTAWLPIDHLILLRTVLVLMVDLRTTIGCLLPNLLILNTSLPPTTMLIIQRWLLMALLTMGLHPHRSLRDHLSPLRATVWKNGRPLLGPSG